MKLIDKKCILGKALIIMALMAFCAPLKIWGQPANWFGDITTIGNTAFVNASMSDRQTVRATQPMLAQTTKSNAKFLFTTSPGVWAPKWVGSTTNYVRTVNSRLTDANAAFIYTSGGWDRDLEVAVVQGRYYTFVIGKNSDANNDISILETNYLPVSIQSVNQQPFLVSANQTVTVSLNLSAPLNTSEYAYLRYSTNNWSTSQLMSLTHQSGSQYTASIPGFADGTEVSYYILTTHQENPSLADVDYLSLRIDNNYGNNYAYTVGATVECGQQTGVVTSNPAFPLPDSPLTIFFNAELGNGGLINYTDDVYIHTGLITSQSTGPTDWKYVKTNWGQNTPETKMTRMGPNLYKLDISSIRNYYNVPTNVQILKVAMVFRSAQPISGTSYLEGKNADGSDIFVDVYEQALNVKILSPSKREPLPPANQAIAVCVEAMENQSISLYLNSTLLTTEATSSLTFPLIPTELTPGTHWIKAIAQNTQGSSVRDSVSIYIRGPLVIEALPQGVKEGINYLSNTSVILVLHDPAGLKQFAFAIGEHSNWKPNDQTYMKRTPDGKHFWITLSGLISGKEYAYQYYIDGKMKIADPYTEKILDPWNDKWISTSTYPSLKPYPYDLTTGIVSIFQTNQTPYNWEVPAFTPPALNETQQDLVIYELLIRDFVDSKRIKHVTDSLDYFVRLGVNAIQLMPIMEFDGNESWGYAPNFFFATDKFYGRKQDYKKFIDECHKRNIAVILDVVPNHAFGQNPMVQMYFNPQAGEYGQPAPENPWFNPVATHPYSVGYDFNHESPYTRAFFKRFFHYWLTEFKVDGFRLDLSKGLTQTWSGGDIGAWSAYDQSRINILTDYYNHIKSVSPNAYVILEHFADNSEETVLANTGMLLWANMDSQFKQVILGYVSNSDFSWAHHSVREWDYPNAIAFMESHDEERQMFYAYTYGNQSGAYNIKDTLTALSRIEMANVLLYGVPGPKMLWQFGELGYDYSIFYGGDRTAPKPPRWDYWNQPHRQKLFRVTSAMLELQKHDAFRFGNYISDFSGLGKRIRLTHSSMNVLIVANMGVNVLEISPGFHNAGTWYDYFSGTPIQVSNPGGHTLYMEPGEYRVFTNIQLSKPFHYFNVTVKSAATQQALPGAQVALTGSGTGTTDVNGLAWFTSKGGNLHYRVTLSGYLPATGTVSIPASEELEVFLQADPNASAETPLPDGKRIYPNPASSNIFMEGFEGFQFSLYDTKGRKYAEGRADSNLYKLSIASFPAGIYLLKLQNKDFSTVQKIIIK